MVCPTCSAAVGTGESICIPLLNMRLQESSTWTDHGLSLECDWCVGCPVWCECTSSADAQCSLVPVLRGNTMLHASNHQHWPDVNSPCQHTAITTLSKPSAELPHHMLKNHSWVFSKPKWPGHVDIALPDSVHLLYCRSTSHKEFNQQPCQDFKAATHVPKPLHHAACHTHSTSTQREQHSSHIWPACAAEGRC
jgi:hypothetical protein